MTPIHLSFVAFVAAGVVAFSQIPAARVAVLETAFGPDDGRRARIADALRELGETPRELFAESLKGKLDVGRADVLFLGSFLHYTPGPHTKTLLREQAKLRALIEGGAVVVVFPQAHGRNVVAAEFAPEAKDESGRRPWGWLEPEAPAEFGSQAYDSTVDLEPDHPLVSAPHRIDSARIAAAKTRQPTQTDSPIGRPGGRFLIGHRYKLASPWLAEYAVGRGRVVFVGGAIDQLEDRHEEARALLGDLCANVLSYAALLRTKAAPPFVPTFKAMPESTRDVVVDPDDRRAFEARVDAAVDRGVAALKKLQKADGSFGKFTASFGAEDYSVGQTCLAAMALLASGVSKRDDEIVRAFASLPRTAPADTYQAGCIAYALEHKAAPDGERFDFRRLSPAERAKFEYRRTLSADERRLMTDCVAWLVRERHRGFWRYLERPKDADLSASQYAALGLMAAERCAVKVPREAYERVADGLLATMGRGKERPYAVLRRPVKSDERPDFEETTKPVGFWNYDAPIKPDWGRGTTDAIGVAMLAIAYDGLSSGGAPDQRGPKIAQAIGFALNHLDSIFRVDVQPSDAARPSDRHPDFYFLYTLERAMELTETRFVGRHDWYREAAEFLCDVQRADGRFDVAGSQFRSDAIHTSFALLTLRRATFPSRTTPR